MKLLPVIACMLILAPPALHAQWPAPGETEGKFDSCRDFSGPRPVVELPNGIAANDGRITRFADFDHVKDGWIPIYLVNLTAKPAPVGLVHGQPGFKAYRELPDGNWERVQPTGGFVMCGDSIRTAVVHPGTFVRFEAAWHPPGDHPATIRYGRPGNKAMETNSGPGFWDPQERDIAQSDSASLPEHPLWFGSGMVGRLPPEFAKPVAKAYYIQRSTVTEKGKTVEKSKRVYFMADLAKRELLKAGEIP